MFLPKSVIRAIGDRIDAITTMIEHLDTGSCDHCNYRTPTQIENFTRVNALNTEIRELEAFLHGDDD